jgi:class 3 adenylate cyclase
MKGKQNRGSDEKNSPKRRVDCAGCVEPYYRGWGIGERKGGGKQVRTAKKNGNKVRLGLARHEVNVVVVQGCACEHCAVRVEGRAGDGGRAVLVEETRVGLEGGEVCAVNIVGLDFVAVGSPVKMRLVAENRGLGG